MSSLSDSSVAYAAGAGISGILAIVGVLIIALFYTDVLVNNPEEWMEYVVPIASGILILMGTVLFFYFAKKAPEVSEVGIPTFIAFVALTGIVMVTLYFTGVFEGDQPPKTEADLGYTPTPTPGDTSRPDNPYVDEYPEFPPCSEEFGPRC
ncbi:MAG: hypothetical protein CMK92_01045 [Pseudomonas sp.]|nr:hypothetical protein [Pseudomonas sp.]